MTARVEKYVYREMTWPEIRDVAREDRVVVVPIATLEDHGPHLPVDCDVRIVEAICEGACARVPDQVVLLPAVTHGYSPHHRDFPGSINIRWNVFVEHLLDITRSLVGHGFRRFILANGHGSNGPLVNMAARLTIVEHPETIACDYFYLVTPQGQEADPQGARVASSPAAWRTPASSRRRSTSPSRPGWYRWTRPRRT